MNDAPGEAKPDQHARGQRQLRARRALRHQHRAEHVEEAAAGQHPRGAVAVGDRAGDGLPEAPDEVLHRDREGERLAVEAAHHRQRLGEQAEGRPQPERHQADQAAGDDHDGGGAPAGRHGATLSRLVQPLNRP